MRGAWRMRSHDTLRVAEARMSTKPFEILDKTRNGV